MIACIRCRGVADTAKSLANRMAGSVAPRCVINSLFSMARRASRSISLTSWTDDWGTANVRSPTWTMRASVIASVKGKTARNVVPPPSVVETLSVPPRSWIVSRTTAMPTPRPLARSASSRVEKPEEQITSSNRRESSLPSGTWRPAARARVAIASTSIPRPSSLTSRMTDSPTVDAARRILAFRTLAERHTIGRHLDAVADGIPNKVENRIHHPLDEELIDLCALSNESTLDPFSAVAG